jgi:hypothetical protein
MHLSLSTRRGLTNLTTGALGALARRGKHSRVNTAT